MSKELALINNELNALFSEIINPPDEQTKVFCVRADGQEVWKAMWKGRLANAEWTQRGPAMAWVDICNRTGKFRS